MRDVMGTACTSNDARDATHPCAYPRHGAVQVLLMMLRSVNPGACAVRMVVYHLVAMQICFCAGEMRYTIPWGGLITCVYSSTNNNVAAPCTCQQHMGITQAASAAPRRCARPLAGCNTPSCHAPMRHIYHHQVPNQGRGLFPTQPIPAGHTIFTEDPLAAIAADATAACDRCTRPLQDAHPYCSTACATAAAQEYAPIQDACDWQPLRAMCAEQGWRFPLLAARILCRAAMEQRSTTPQTGTKAPGSVPPVLDRVMLLCHANIPTPPPEWHAAHALVLEALREGVGSHAARVASWDAFLGILARCHINAFRCAIAPRVVYLCGTT